MKYEPTLDLTRTVTDETAAHLEGDVYTPTGDLLNLFSLLLRFRFFIGLSMVVTLLIGVICAFSISKKFESTARIVPPQGSQSSAISALGQLNALAGLAGKDLGIKNSADFYIGLLKSQSTADAVIKKFDLQKVYRDRAMVDTRRDLAEHTDIFAGKDGIINISVLDKDPVRASEIANGYVEALQQLTKRLAISEASQRRYFYEQQVQAASEKLAQSEIAFKKTQESTGLLHSSEQARVIIENLAQLKAQIVAEQVRLAALQTYATNENPGVVAAESRLAALRQQLDQAEHSSSKQGDFQLPVTKVPEAELEYLRSLREVKVNETLYELLASFLESARIDEAKSAQFIQVVDLAVPADRKSQPHRALILLTFLLGGLIITIVSILLYAKGLSIARNPKYQYQMSRLQNALAKPWKPLRFT